MATVNVAKVSSKNLNRVPITDGQMIFVTDIRKIYFDYNGTRVDYCTPESKLTVDWEDDLTYIPYKGEIIIYEDFQVESDGNFVPGIKIGDGVRYAATLPFITQNYAPKKDLEDHIKDTLRHITSEERDFWNNKVSCHTDELDPETIVFTVD